VKKLYSHASVLLLFVVVIIALPAFSQSKPMVTKFADQSSSQLKLAPVQDPHSYGNPQQVRVKHVDLKLDVDFAQKMLKGYAEMTVQRAANAPDAPLVVDTEKLAVSKVEAASPGSAAKFSKVDYKLGATDPILGTPLTISLPKSATRVRIYYSTSPEGSALQWLTPAQTAGKKFPYFFTQSEAIHGRSWIPLQDSPSVRVTYSAHIKPPNGLVAMMSAEGNPQPKTSIASASASASARVFSFQMNIPIPTYLIALAVGDLVFRPLGPRSGVYDEPSVVDRDAKELEDVPQMIKTTEKLYGPYAWGRYDVLILPPSFPYGGMENPRLTFASPTIISGDKSLVSVISHELAHSWSGNTVTNATWSDFWLNEGFTTYIERRIVEAVYGKKLADMQWVLGRQVLDRDTKDLDPRDQLLHIDLKGRDPDEGSTELPYEKGSLMLKQMELAFGREQFDNFLRGYFKHFAFHSITTQDFVDYLKEHLFKENPKAAAQIPLDEWLYKPGVPANAPVIKSNAFAQVEKQERSWLEGQAQLSSLKTEGWTTQEWLHFLKLLPQDIGAAKMADLDKQFHFTQSGNIEITLQWLLLAIKNDYKPAYPKLEQTLNSVGRRKIIKPLYQELAKTPEGKQYAKRIYKEARASYHPILAKEIDQLLGN
jgi:leukotriene-A4 hydrolase